ncbi:glycosyltransferase [Guptibacillus hwajinpoensis]|uniref:glycosyltransferase n=1 Tax=Guptibacillus hwajinpoensis TaxID=208199 RepID=UPI00384E4265
MELLLVLEHHFYRDENGEVWSERVIDREFIGRYLKVFNNVTVCARVSNKLPVKGNLKKVSGENTSFLPLPDFKGYTGLILNMPKVLRIFLMNFKKFESVIFRAPSPLSLILYRFSIDKVKVGVEFVMGADQFFSNKNIIMKVINRIITKEAQSLCLKANAVSYVTSEYLQKIYPSHSIRYGPDKQHFDSHYSSASLQDYNYYRKNWVLDNEPVIFNIVHVGYMDSDRKGHKILIDSAKQVIEKGYNIRVTFVGDGSLKESFIKQTIEHGIEDKVIFHGETNDKKEIVEILKQAHLFVLPSKSEGLPRVIIEAMATSTPCLASGVDGIPELLDEEYIVRSNFTDEYTEKIIGLFSNWEEMINASEKNYEKAKTFHNDILDKKRTEFYRQLKEM